MKRLTYRAAATALAALLLGVTAYADDASVPNDAFTATLADGYSAFTKQVQTTKSPEGDIETTTWVSKAPTGEALVVTMSHMPGKILDPQKLMSSTRDSLLKSLGATVESEVAGSGEPPSTNVDFRSNAAFFRAHLTVVDENLYQLLYVGRSAEQRTAPAVQQMFDSFKIARPQS